MQIMYQVSRFVFFCMMVLLAACGDGAYGLYDSSTTTATPPGGTYSSAQNVKLSSDLSSTTIYYTTDGSDPTLNGVEYTTTIFITTTTTLKFFGLRFGPNDTRLQETVKTELYIITP